MGGMLGRGEGGGAGRSREGFRDAATSPRSPGHGHSLPATDPTIIPRLRAIQCKSVSQISWGQNTPGHPSPALSSHRLVRLAPS